MKWNKLLPQVGEASLELYGNRRVIVSDCRSVDEYGETSLLLDLGDVRARISGRGLTVASFAFGQADVTGEIVSLEFVN